MLAEVAVPDSSNSPAVGEGEAAKGTTRKRKPAAAPASTGRKAARRRGRPADSETETDEEMVEEAEDGRGGGAARRQATEALAATGLVEELMVCAMLRTCDASIMYGKQKTCRATMMRGECCRSIAASCHTGYGLCKSQGAGRP